MSATLPLLTDAEIDELRDMDRKAHQIPFRGAVLKIDLAAGKSEATLEDCWPDPNAEVFYLFNVESGTDPDTDAADVQVMMAARNALPCLLDFTDRARKLLTRIEWEGRNGNDDEHAYCPACDSASPRHEPDCELAALLGNTTPMISTSSSWTSNHWIKAMHCESCGFFMLTQPTLCMTRENHGASKYEEACVYSVGAFLRWMAE